MGTIYITRHGETLWNLEGRMQGHNNSPLSELGVLQAKWLSYRLQNVAFDRAYSSSSERALHTAQIILGNQEAEIIACPELKEIYLGSWEGMTHQEVARQYTQEHHHFWKQPESYQPIDGESFQELTNRVSTFFNQLLAAHPKDTLLLVSHAVTIKALLNALLRKGQIRTLWEGPLLKPTCLTVITHQDGEVQFDMIGDTSHYQRENGAGGWFDVKP